MKHLYTTRVFSLPKKEWQTLPTTINEKNLKSVYISDYLVYNLKVN